MSKLICTIEGSSRHVEYTSDAKFKGIMSGNVMIIYRPDGVQIEYWTRLYNKDYTIKDLIDETDRAGRDYGKSAASDV